MTTHAASAVAETPADAWEELGRQAAPSLEKVSCAVVVGVDPDRAARVALGIARVASARRHVAIADLVGDLAPLYAVAGGADAFGLSDCFSDRLPLSDVARPSPDCDTLFILPAGTPPVATYDILAHDRWPRLIRGFAEAGALLLLVAPLDAPGLERLAAAAGGIVAVDTPPQRVRRYPLLFAVAAPVAVAAPLPERGSGRMRWLVFAAMLIIGVLAAALALRNRRAASAQRSHTAPSAARALDVPTLPPEGTPARSDTVRLRSVVNPSDSTKAALYAVELVAANTAASANSALQEGLDAVSAEDRTTAVVVPVPLGATTLWYTAVVGAWNSRTAADSLLAGLRGRGIVRQNSGIVVRVPYALLIEAGLPRSRSDSVVRHWRARGVAAYALLQDDGSVRVYAGAFQTEAQAAPLAAMVRDMGVPPQIAFRTGRAF